jgi:hypothetical protein
MFHFVEQGGGARFQVFTGAFAGAEQGGAAGRRGQALPGCLAGCSGQRESCSIRAFIVCNHELQHGVPEGAEQERQRWS